MSATEPETQYTPGRVAFNIVMGCGDSDDYDFQSPAKQRDWETAVQEAARMILAGPQWVLRPVPGRRGESAYYLTRGAGAALEIETLGDKEAKALLDDLIRILTKAPDA
jgi:hypothetical protein